jgi:hypothetical protein
MHAMLSCTRRPVQRLETVPGRTAFGFRFEAVFFLLLFVLTFSSQLSAQVDLGRVAGSITDPSGAVLQGAKVVVTNLDTGVTRSTASDTGGLYVIPSLPAGRYQITVESNGFQSSSQTADVTVGGTLERSFRLSVDGTKQQVVVSAQSGLDLQTESHTVGGILGTNQLEQLPVSGRNPLAYASVEPGVSPGNDASVSTSSAQFFGNTGNSIVLGGALDQETGFLQDGVENVTLLTQTANILPSAESISELNVQTNGSDARYRQPGIINITTRGGTNAFHGTAYDFLQNDDLNAKSYNLTTSAQTKTPLRYNLFGANLGGPIWKNRAFFFFDYSGLRDQNTTQTLYRVPTPAELQGDFTGEQTLYDPTSYKTATGGNISYLTETGKNAIPGGASAFDPFAVQYLKYLPAANIPLNTALNANYQIPLKQTITNDQYLGRVDWALSEKDQIYGAFGYANMPTTNPTLVPNLFGRIYQGKSVNALGEETHTFSTRLVNSARFGYNRSNYFETIQGAGVENYVQAFGLQNLAPLPQQWAPPYVNLASIINPGYPYAPQGAIQNRFQGVDQLNFIMGKHSLFFGGELIITRFNGNWVIANNGSYNFTGLFTSQFVGGAQSKTNTGNSLADFLLGFPASATGATGTSAGQFHETEAAGFFQDDWKVLQNLTLNLGVRYQFDNPPNDATGHSSIYDLPTNQTLPGTWYTNYNDWAPRVGFAFAASPSTVIRGGAGIYYSQPPYNFLQFLLAHAPNFIPQAPAFQITDPTPIQTVFVANPSAAGQVPQTLGLHMPDTNVQEFNLFVEQRLAKTFLATVGYAGEIGRHESIRLNANQPNAIAPGTTTTKYNLRPYTYISDVFGQYNIGGSNSNALEAKIDGRFQSGSRLLASYTWAKSMDIADGDRNPITSYYNPQLNYALAAWDRTNSFVLSGVYKLPFGPGQRFMQSNQPFTRLATAGWAFTGIYHLASGLPVSISETNNADTGVDETFFAQKVCDPTTGFTRSKTEYFNKSCFVQTGPFAYGVGGRASVRQPGIDNLDVGFDKSFFLTETQQLQFRAEAFNALNHAQFSLPGSIAVSSTSLGAITGTSRPMRTMQLALRYSF